MCPYYFVALAYYLNSPDTPLPTRVGEPKEIVYQTRVRDDATQNTIERKMLAAGIAEIRTVGGAGALYEISGVCSVEYPYLEREDHFQALRYAAWLAEEREIPLASA
jgi:hypothetical protein